MAKSQGITFFNFGGGCIVRLLVALESLRKVYDGPVTLQLAKDDPHNQQALNDLKRYADIQWFDLARLAKRNLKSVIKPSLFKLSPYQTTLMLDGDLLIQKDPTELLTATADHGFLVTQFSTWKCDGGRMRKRVDRCKDWLWPSDMRYLSGKWPAINIGVMGWDKSAPQVLADWEWMTMKLAGQHIADEVACQCVFHRHPHVVAADTWNSSCLYATQQPKDAAILHYHGNKHTAIDRPSSRLWVKALAELKAGGKIRHLDTYLKWPDKALLGLLKSRPNVLQEALKWD